MFIEVDCVICGKVFVMTPSLYNEGGNYCSKGCLGKKNEADNNVSCFICGKNFHVKPSYLFLKNSNRICCSKECSNKERSEISNGGDLNNSFENNIRFTEHGYVKVRNMTHPHRDSENFVLMHRLVYEEYLKGVRDFEYLEFNDEVQDYVLSKDTYVHHVDHNKLNNSLDNLEPISFRDEVTQRFKEQGKVLSGTLFKKHNTDAGLDVSSSEDLTILAGKSSLVSTNLKIAVPEGCVGLLWSRSGLSVKHRIEVGAGCIDAGYTGEVKVHLYNFGDSDFKICAGDRVAQLLTIPINLIRYTIVDHLEDTNRSSDGFGSTGTKT